MDYKARFIDNVSDRGFSYAAIELFRDQFEQVATYREYCSLLGTDPAKVRRLQDIPFLPVELFRRHEIVRSGRAVEKIFESSGTTGSEKSRHYVTDVGTYKWSMTRTFESLFGPLNDLCILALLPDYLERDNSSLVFMVNELIQQSAHPDNGFYLHDLPALAKILTELNEKGQKTILFGVSFALLDLAEAFSLDLEHVTIIETGGMKGRRKEIVREDLHASIRRGLKVSSICSEYGMTELLSQAYAINGGLFKTPPWMKVLIRDVNDPFHFRDHGIVGGINVIDLANMNSCAFIATYDLGKVHEDGSFEVLGRFDHSDLRGCNLLID